MTHIRLTLTISGEESDPESIGELLISAGAGSVEILSEPIYLVVCCAEADEALVLTTAQQLGTSVTKRELIPECNWAALCPELLHPIKAGIFCVNPCASDNGILPQDGVIHIIPGMGFGTGHHDTTHALLQMISGLSEDPKYAVLEDSSMSIVDVGTGSGILSIAAAMAFPNASVVATDIDEAALGNAAENCRINGVSGHVSLLHCSIPALSSPADLVIANLYAELLIQLRDELFSLLKPGGTLLLSGIAVERDDEVAAVFSELPLRLEKRWESPISSEQPLSTMRWVARRYTRID